jgi:hypothetical protein
MESSKPLRLCCFNAHYTPRTSLGTAAARVGQRLRGSTPGPLGPLPSHSWILGRPYVLQTARDDGHGRAYQSLTINVQESWLPCYPLFVDPGMSRPNEFSPPFHGTSHTACIHSNFQGADRARRWPWAEWRRGVRSATGRFRFQERKYPGDNGDGVIFDKGSKVGQGNEDKD